jgi:hypothetical protein
VRWGLFVYSFALGVLDFLQSERLYHPVKIPSSEVQLALAKGHENTADRVQLPRTGGVRGGLDGGISEF